LCLVYKSNSIPCLRNHKEAVLDLIKLSKLLIQVNTRRNQLDHLICQLRHPLKVVPLDHNHVTLLIFALHYGHLRMLLNQAANVLWQRAQGI